MARKREIVPVGPRSLNPLPVVSTRDVLEAFLDGRNQNTLEAYVFDLTDFGRFLGESNPAAAIEALLAAGHGGANGIALRYKADLTNRGLAAATIARRLAALRSMIKVARTIGRVSWSLDVDGPKAQPYRDTRGPGLDGWRRIMAESRQRAAADTDRPNPASARGKRDMALVRLMHDLGLRRGECVALDLAHLSLDTDPPTVEVVGKGKTEPIRMTLPSQVRDALRAWIAVRGDDPGPLFIRLDPAASGGLERITGDSVCRMVRGMSRKAGLSRETRPHGLRHQGITRALDLAGGDVRRVQRFSRHSKLETLMRYDDARRDDAGALARQLAEDE
jgi:integrase/recombinase XerC